MTTYDASLDYWSAHSTRPTQEYASNSIADEMVEVDDINEIVSLEELTFDRPSAIRRFNGSHPGFIWFLLANVLVTPLLVYAGFQIVASHPPTVLNALMISSGAQSMSAGDLVTLVKSEDKLAYWIKPVPGDTYTKNSTQDGVNSISYIPSDAKLSDLNQVNLTIKTYRNIAVYNAQLQPLSAANDTTITTATGANVQYSKASLNRMIVSFTHKPEIVVVQYPTVQNVTTLVRDAKSLVPIK